LYAEKPRADESNSPGCRAQGVSLAARRENPRRFNLAAPAGFEAGVTALKAIPLGKARQGAGGRPPLPSREELARAGDDALCRAFLAGSEDAFGELVHRHQTLVYALVRRYAKGPEDARDLTQRAFLRAFEAARRALPRLSGAEDVPFKAWLARIAINLGKNHARQALRWRLLPVTALEKAEAPGPTAPETLARQEREARARKAVLSLPRRQREVLTLRVDGGLAFAEIAQALGITANNAKVHFHHAVQRLKAELAAEDAEENRR